MPAQSNSLYLQEEYKKRSNSNLRQQVVNIPSITNLNGDPYSTTEKPEFRYQSVY
jgi:hypothetical protein